MGSISEKILRVRDFQIEIHKYTNTKLKILSGERQKILCVTTINIRNWLKASLSKVSNCQCICMAVLGYWFFGDDPDSQIQIQKEIQKYKYRNTRQKISVSVWSCEDIGYWRPSGQNQSASLQSLSFAFSLSFFILYIFLSTF